MNEEVNSKSPNVIELIIMLIMIPFVVFLMLKMRSFELNDDVDYFLKKIESNKEESLSLFKESDKRFSNILSNNTGLELSVVSSSKNNISLSLYKNETIIYTRKNGQICVKILPFFLNDKSDIIELIDIYNIHMENCSYSYYEYKIKEDAYKNLSEFVDYTSSREVLFSEKTQELLLRNKSLILRAAFEYTATSSRSKYFGKTPTEALKTLKEIETFDFLTGE